MWGMNGYKWEDLSFGTNNFGLMTLICEFELFNLGFISWSKGNLNHRFFVQRLFVGTKTFDLVTLPLDFDLPLKIFNLGCILWSKVNSFDIWVISSLWKNILFGTKTFWPSDLDLRKTLTWAISFQQNGKNLLLIYINFNWGRYDFDMRDIEANKKR
jgi:hypothetical protein